MQILLPLLLISTAIVATLAMIQFLALSIVTRLIKFEKQDFVTALKVTGLWSVVGFICLLTFVINLYFTFNFFLFILVSIILVAIYATAGFVLIRYFYRESWRNTIIASLGSFGWGLVVCSIIVILLLYISAPPPPPPHFDCAGFSQIVPLDHKISSLNNTFSLILSNEAGTRLSIPEEGVNVIIYRINCTSSFGRDDFRPGEIIRVDMSCPGISDEYSVRDYYRVNIQIEYINLVSGIKHISSGDCWGFIE